MVSWSEIVVEIVLLNCDFFIIFAMQSFCSWAGRLLCFFIIQGHCKAKSGFCLASRSDEELFSSRCFAPCNAEIISAEYAVIRS